MYYLGRFSEIWFTVFFLFFFFTHMHTRTHTQLSMPFPEGGLVYDYRLDDGGVSRTTKGEDDEEEKKPVAKAKVCCSQGVL